MIIFWHDGIGGEMMEDHNREKRALERAALHQFLQIYNANRSPNYRLLYMRERPDAVLEETTSRLQLGVEVTHLFYDAEEAKRILGRSRPTEPGEERVEWLLAELNNRIRSKEEKIRGYAHDYPLSLLIRNASPLFGMSDILAAKPLIYRPNESSFRDVWLLSRDGVDNEWLLLHVNDLLLEQALGCAWRES